MWLCGTFGVVRSLAQILEAHTSPHPTLYNVVWLGTRFGACLLGSCCGLLCPSMTLFACAGLVLLEVSVLVFLLQGHLVSGQDVSCPQAATQRSIEVHCAFDPWPPLQALLQSVILSGAVAAAETLVAAALVFGAGVPLFLYGCVLALPLSSHGSSTSTHVRHCCCRGSGDDPAGDMRWGKWGFWLLHTLLFGGIYAAMLALPFTRWRVSCSLCEAVSSSGRPTQLLLCRTGSPPSPASTDTSWCCLGSTSALPWVRGCCGACLQSRPLWPEACRAARCTAAGQPAGGGVLRVWPGALGLLCAAAPGVLASGAGTAPRRLPLMAAVRAAHLCNLLGRVLPRRPRPGAAALQRDAGLGVV